MSGTLTVQNIQGPSSGANANKIIIPSGQTLDASAGGLIPSAGGVLQVVEDSFSTQYSTSSNSDVDYRSVTITPQFSSSKILVMVTLMAKAVSSNGFAFTYIKGKRDGTVIWDGYPVVGGNGGFYDVRGVASFLKLDAPNTTSTVTYTFSHNANYTDQSVYINNGTDPSTIILMEIAG